MDIRQYLCDNILITDGAMGTYYSEISGQDVSDSELANKKNPEIIKKIHKSYIQSGADLIRTNTFSLNSFILDKSTSEIEELFTAGFKIARQAVEQTAKEGPVFIAADIGPLPQQVEENIIKEPEEIISEYKFIIDTFFSAGADIFLFETFSDLQYLPEITKYIKNINQNSFVLTQFALDHNGFTRKGLPVQEVVEKISDVKTVDAYGFNCGVGPTHLYDIMKKLNFPEGDIISALPNAGYPEIISERTIYSKNADYFAEVMTDIKKLGVNIIGGCCGTTPVHIQKLSKKLAGKPVTKIKQNVISSEKEVTPRRGENKFQEKLQQGKFVTAVELDPPFSTEIGEVLDKVRILAEDGRTDIITVPDSPLGRVRLDSVMFAAKIFREFGLDTLPHLTCRDQNSIGLKSSIMSANIEGLRNLLLVTGDPVPNSADSKSQGVFNLNSYQLIELIAEINKQMLGENTFYLGSGLNLNTEQISHEIDRMEKKIAAGARFFMTQPVFTTKAIDFIRKFEQPENIKIIAGILPPISYKNARFLNNEIPGITIPDTLINQFKPSMSRSQAEKTGIKIAVSRAEKMKNHVDGFYFIPPFNRVHLVCEILDQLEIRV
ncbi:MAG: bifunctional homocysteine S-methyltransferase/methylenetetrahydrofolate reductase [Bacillota bacterium]